MLSHDFRFMIFIYSLDEGFVGFTRRGLSETCQNECNFNSLLLQISIRVLVPLTVIVRSMKTTRVIALTILMMISGQSQKIIKLFDKDLYC